MQCYAPLRSPWLKTIICIYLFNWLKSDWLLIRERHAVLHVIIFCFEFLYIFLVFFFVFFFNFLDCPLFFIFYFKYQLFLKCSKKVSKKTGLRKKVPKWCLIKKKTSKRSTKIILTKCTKQTFFQRKYIKTISARIRCCLILQNWLFKNYPKSYKILNDVFHI